MSAAPRIYVIKRKRIIKSHHGGSWKIALADFMTAMMALFLVLWLLATSSKTELEGVAEYFRTPLLVAIAGGDRPTASNSAIPGGGADPIHEVGEQARIDVRQQTRPADMQRNFRELRARIEAATMADAELRGLGDQMRIYITPEGLLIQLVDSDRRPMFERGSDKVEPYMSRLLHTIAPLLNELPNRVSISGHTDNLPYRGANPDYSNWELSTDRANASRRELILGGLDPRKMVRVVGMSDQAPMADTRADDPVNRRIELMMLDEMATTQMRMQLPTESAADVPGAPGFDLPEPVAELQ